MRDALAVTRDGQVFRCSSVGVEGLATGEAVFNTAMSGYQEIFTDPSYAGQIVAMTSPQIGNYGVTAADSQAEKAFAAGVIMRAMTHSTSNWRAEGSLSDFFLAHAIVAVADLDTRRLTRLIRDRGAQPIAISSGHDEAELQEIASLLPGMEGQNLVKEVTTEDPYFSAATADKKGVVVALDFGIKRDIVRRLNAGGHDVWVLPATASADEIRSLTPDGLFLSNGPGDPEPLAAPVATIRELLGEVPIFGICLGHQLLGLALGATTYKLGFGHHGGNHPVRNLKDGKVAITSQNHGFSVDPWSLSSEGTSERAEASGKPALPILMKSKSGDVIPSHQNLNDGTLEGIRCLEVPAFSVQYHPEAAPGPHDALGLFSDFDELMGF